MKGIILLLVSLLLLVVPGITFGATAKCKVVEVSGNKVQLQCTQIVGKIKNGQWVKMKTEDNK